MGGELESHDQYHGGVDSQSNQPVARAVALAVDCGLT